MRPSLSISALLLLLLAGRPDAVAAEFRADRVVRLENTIGSDLFAAGRDVHLGGAVSGDAYAAGRGIGIAGGVAEDAYLAGMTVTVDGAVGGDLVAIGLDVGIAGRVGGDVTAAGNAIQVAEGAQVGGDLTASGGEVTVAGQIAGEARLAGSVVTISGQILGDVDVAAETLVLVPGARIMGAIRHRGPDLQAVPESVTVGGGVIHEPEAHEDGAFSLAGSVGSALAFFLVGAAVFLVFPRFTLQAAAEVLDRPGRAALVGLAGLILIPVLAVIIMITIIGIPVGLLLLLLYAAGIFVGSAVTGFAAAARMARSPAGMTGGQLLGRFALFVVLVGLIGMIPVVGDLIGLVVVVLGLGALLARLATSRRTSTA